MLWIFGFSENVSFDQILMVAQLLISE